MRHRGRWQIVRGQRAGSRGQERTPLPAGFFTIWSTVALDLVGFGIAIPVLGIYAKRLGASPTVVGLLFASFSVAQLLFAPVWGRLSDRIGRKPVILISLFGTAAGSFITGAAGSVLVLFLGRVVDGASGASVSVAQAAVTDLASPQERPRLLGMLGAAFGIGFVAGPAIGSLAALGGARLPFYVAGGLALVNALVAIKRLPETSTEHHRAAAAGARRAVIPRGGLLARLALAGFAATAAFSAFEATFALLGQRRFSLTESSAAGVFVAIGLFLVIIQGGLIGPVTTRLSATSVLRVGLVVNVAGLLALAAATSWPVLVVALALLVVGQGFSTPTLSSLVANAARPEERGGALGFQQSVGGLARVVGPAAGGALFDHAGIPVPYVVGAALTLLALGVLLAPGAEAPPGGPAHGASGHGASGRGASGHGASGHGASGHGAQPASSSTQG